MDELVSTDGYIVFKISDIVELCEQQGVNAVAMLYMYDVVLANLATVAGKERRYLVIEDDKPEFGVVWDMIVARLDREA